MANIAFIGLGNMGHPMCRHLLRAGHAVTGFDLSPERRAALEQLGGRAATDIADAVGAADVVLTMLPTGRHVRKVYEGEGGVLAHAPAGALLIDSSTIDIDNSRAVSQAAAQAGFTMVDAPVSGAVPAAEAGRLTFMVGGTAEGYARAVPVLEAMGYRFFHIGESGAGQALKICNNMMTGISMVAISEVFTLADRLGLDPTTVRDVMLGSSGNCWALEHYCPVPGPLPTSPASRDYAPGFTGHMMLKDMRLSQEAAAGASAATPLAGTAAAIYQMLVANGHGDRDFSYVFKMISGR
ncbi:MAG: 3-hydroxyisobutyrate dehydrogenase [Rhizobiales bacterium]|nr:3-hydroxyisobutyrate dehydrogenase [Hyphomicrobiales bacterium]